MELYPQPSTQARKQHGPTSDATQPPPPHRGNRLQTLTALPSLPVPELSIIGVTQVFLCAASLADTMAGKDGAVAMVTRYSVFTVGFFQTP